MPASSTRDVSFCARSFFLADNRDERVIRGAHSLLRPIAAPVRRPRTSGGVASDHELHGEAGMYNPADARICAGNSCFCRMRSVPLGVLSLRHKDYRQWFVALQSHLCTYKPGLADDRYFFLRGRRRPIVVVRRLLEDICALPMHRSLFGRVM